MGLTGKQAAFINAYLGPARFNATVAAKLAAYRATSRHSFEAIGSENLTKPAIRAAIDEHFRLSRMSGEEVLVELTKLARGSSKDQIKALALLSQHHGLLDGRPFVDQRELDRQLEAEIDKIHAGYQEQARKINEEIDDVKRKVKHTNDSFHLVISNVREEFVNDPPGLRALDRLLEYFDACIEGKEPPIKAEDIPAKPAKVEVIIPPSRRLQPATVERLMADVIEVEETPEEPKRGLIIISADNAPPNAQSNFPLPCSHGYHGGCSLCSARYA